MQLLVDVGSWQSAVHDHRRHKHWENQGSNRCVIKIVNAKVRLKDTADDAREGPDADAQTRPEHGFAVDVRLHEVWQHRLDQDVESAHAERQHGAHQVHREQSGFLVKTQRT